MNGQAGQVPQGMPGGGFPQGGPPGGGRGFGGGPGGLGGPLVSIVLIGLFVLLLIVLAIAFYKICKKAGMSSVLGILMLVPVVNLGVALYVAFAEWPVLAELDRLKMIVATSTQAAAPAPAPVAAPTAIPPVTDAPAGAL